MWVWREKKKRQETKLQGKILIFYEVFVVRRESIIGFRGFTQYLSPSVKPFICTSRNKEAFLCSFGTILSEQTNIYKYVFELL